MIYLPTFSRKKIIFFQYISFITLHIVVEDWLPWTIADESYIGLKNICGVAHSNQLLFFFFFFKLLIKNSVEI